MKFIVDSGIFRVIFLHPYPKNKAMGLNHDAIAYQSHHGQEENKVLCKPFEGLNPSRYFELFSANTEKCKDANYTHKPKLEKKIEKEANRGKILFS